MLGQQLQDLHDQSLAELRELWRKHYHSLAPDIGVDLLRRGIAWRMQAKLHGGLTVATCRSIGKQLAQLEKTGEVDCLRNSRIKTGTRLIRSWKGKTYYVLVLDDGFEHDGRRYGSLSQIARAITGAHWSGPRFFGLCRRKTGSSG